MIQTIAGYFNIQNLSTKRKKWEFHSNLESLRLLFIIFSFKSVVLLSFLQHREKQKIFNVLNINKMFIRLNGKKTKRQNFPAYFKDTIL